MLSSRFVVACPTIPEDQFWSEMSLGGFAEEIEISFFN